MATYTGTGSERVSIGHVLSRAFAVIANNPAVMLGVAFLLGALPSGIIGYFTQSFRVGLAGQPDGIRDGVFLTIGTGIIGLVLAMIVQGALVRATVAYAEGRRANFAESLTAGLRVALPLILLAIIVGLGVVLGSILFIVPGVMLYILWSVAAPALVEENIGVFGALSRSRELTKGARWKVFGLQLIILIAIWIVSAVIGYLSIVMGGGVAGFAQNMATGLPIGVFVVQAVLSTLINAFWSAAQTSLYVELRNWKDGPQTERLSEVFA